MISSESANAAVSNSSEKGQNPRPENCRVAHPVASKPPAEDGPHARPLIPEFLLKLDCIHRATARSHVRVRLYADDSVSIGYSVRTNHAGNALDVNE